MLNDRISDVGVLDKAVVLLEALAASSSSVSLAQLASLTGIHRATAHRLLTSLHVHGLVRVDEQSRWSLGARLIAFGNRAELGLPLQDVAGHALAALRDETEESVQLYVRQGSTRVCVASLESPHGLRTIVGLGETLPLSKGSAGAVLLDAGGVRELGWAQSVGERQAGVASVSAPILDRTGTIRAAVSVSGPIERTTKQPGEKYAYSVMASARAIELSAGWREELRSD